MLLPAVLSEAKSLTRHFKQSMRQVLSNTDLKRLNVFTFVYLQERLVPLFRLNKVIQILKLSLDRVPIATSCALTLGTGDEDTSSRARYENHNGFSSLKPLACARI